MTMMRKTLLDIAKSGVLAPSADNQHVFKIEILDTTIRLWPTREFAVVTDQLRRVLGQISLGAVVENMQLRAGELGLVAHISWCPANNMGLLVQLNFEPASAENGDALAAAIPARHTNRRMYRGPALSDGETELLNAAVAPVNGVQLVWLRNGARQRALGLIWRAESERFLRKRLHEDLFSSIRFDLPWRVTADWALPPGSLEIEVPMRPLFKALRHWPLMRPMTWVGVHRLIGLRAGWLPAWQAPALGLLATSMPINQGAPAVGAALERLWLRATLLDLALQPMAASAVLPLQTTTDFGASDALRSALVAGWQAIAPGVTPLMVFRMGHAAPPTVTSHRRSLESYLVTPSQTEISNPAKSSF